MSTVELSAGTVEYTDTGGSGPALVLLHGLLMDGSLWDDLHDVTLVGNDTGGALVQLLMAEDNPRLGPVDPPGAAPAGDPARRRAGAPRRRGRPSAARRRRAEIYLNGL
jgi:hypothetical protein